MCFISFIALAIFAFLTCTVTDAFGEEKKSTCQKKKKKGVFLCVSQSPYIYSKQREHNTTQHNGSSVTLAVSLALVFTKGCYSAIYNKPVIYLTH